MTVEKLFTAEIRRNIRGLILVLQSDEDPFIAKSYVIEKLQRVLNGSVIWHPHINDELDSIEEQERRRDGI